LHIIYFDFFLEFVLGVRTPAIRAVVASGLSRITQRAGNRVGGVKELQALLQATVISFLLMKKF
jgi:hypothetical protein